MIALLLAVSAIAQAAPAQDSVFRHRQHARLFASCTTCHAGVTTGRAADVMPAPVQCATCHDGRAEARVSWRPRALEPTNLRFTHESHADRVRREGDSALTCVACHAAQDAGTFMDAGRAAPERCVSCHAHRATTHLASARCQSCHVPLREAQALSVARIAEFPRPPSHDSGFVFSHGAEARSASCQVCHTRESCAACHANAGRVPQIAALGSDARVAAIAALRPPRYPEPPSHRPASFSRTHGADAAATGATCASCHTRESCLTCHSSEERLGAIARLPDRAADAAPGVDLSGRRPPDHGPSFRSEHRGAAAASASCTSCHTASFCASCHAETPGAGFHIANFAVRHASEAYRADTECSSCHQVTAFCSSCHRQSGVAARGGVTPGTFHTGVANWTFAHGGVARRSLETCASCHTQNFCAQCHSATRGWGVSPHGTRPPEGSRNAPACRFCHA